MISDPRCGNRFVIHIHLHIKNDQAAKRAKVIATNQARQRTQPSSPYIQYTFQSTRHSRLHLFSQCDSAQEEFWFKATLEKSQGVIGLRSFMYLHAF